MILIIWNSGKAKECARAIEHALQEPVQVVASLHDGCECLKTREFSAVVVDQWITEAEPEPASTVFSHLGTAVPVFVNFSISGVERILRELRVALSRRGLEAALARHSVRQALREELRDDVTALLLSSGLALKETVANEAVRTRLQQIQDVATRMKDKLTTESEEPAANPASSRAGE
ncbi:MAG TPA: hypothetical protein VH596_08930 [Terriglobales bacterium]